MTYWQETGSLVNSALKKWGIPLRIQNKSQTYSAGSYDEGAWSESGGVFEQDALMLPVSARVDEQLIESGKIVLGDYKLYVGSGTDIKQGADLVIAGGSYDITEDGIDDYPNPDSIIFRKVFIRSKI